MKQEDTSLKYEVITLREKVRQLEETLDTFRSHKVDTVVPLQNKPSIISTPRGSDPTYRQDSAKKTGIFLILSRNGMILYADSPFTDMIQLPLNRVLGNPLLNYIPPRYRLEIEEGLRTIVKEVCRADVTIRQGSLSIPVHISMHALSTDDDTKIAVIITDQSIYEGENRLNTQLLNAIGDAVIATDPDDEILFWNEAANCLYGWIPEEVVGRNIADVFAPELSNIDGVAISGSIDRGEIWSGECLVHHRDGHQFPVHTTKSPLIGDDEELIAMISISHDISDQKNTEDILRRSKVDLQRAQKLLDAVTKATDVLIAIQDVNLQYIFFNQTYKENIRQLTGKELSIGMNMIDLFAEDPSEQRMAVDEWRKVLQGKSVDQVIKFDYEGEDSRFYHVIHTPIRDSMGTIVAAGEVSYDVTKQLQIEETLRETKEYLNKLIASANAPIIVWDPNFKITFFNRAFEYLTEWNAKDVIGKKIDLLLPDEYSSEAMNLIRKTQSGEIWESVEIPILHKKGAIRTLLWNSAAIYAADGKTLVSTIAQGQDITDRKKIEADYRKRAIDFEKLNTTLIQEIQQRELSDIRLKKAFSLLNATLESTADGICVIDLQNRITSYNQNYVFMWNIPRDLIESRDSIEVMNYLLPQLKNPENYIADRNNILSNSLSESFDMIEFKDGKVFERYSKPQMIESTVVGRVWSFRDITERKRVEERLLSSLQEKNVLLREVNHRVKNNLQLISSLLDMTRMRSDKESTINILTDMMLKVKTMAQIHTQLYESKEFGCINITDQFKDQVIALSDIFANKNQEIRCEIDPSEVMLPVDKALPCALVVNEILSNAYKHAFKGRKIGMIKISVVQENGRIRITVLDDGVGLPPHLDIIHSKSLGLKLIRTLVEHQLRGTISLKSRDGTEVTIEFPVTIVGM
ncbi:MAG: PAS domain S-box protein [Methanocalculus sp.]|uniref:PAS domain S-box protein n=1 Tax=Methanocalculus sp. TaxID=2004547 RepID=UPI00271EA10E|nr:PAS domain S-box protein [Methanocalculus sp.]MDO9539190.1 PAS domain S-box protein [Methanocalculus sp.]